MLGIAKGGDVALGLVHQQINMPLRAVKKLAVDTNMIGFRVGLAAQFSDHLAIYGHESAGDDLLGLAARSNSGGGDDFLQTFSRHVRVVLQETRRTTQDSILQRKNNPGSRVTSIVTVFSLSSWACADGLFSNGSGTGRLTVLPADSVAAVATRVWIAISGWVRIGVRSVAVELTYGVNTGLAMLAANAIVLNGSF